MRRRCRRGGCPIATASSAIGRRARGTDPWVELGTEREGPLQVLDESANLGGQPAAGGPYGKDGHCSLEGRQESDDGAFPEFCGEEPCWRLGNAQVLEHTHPHLFDIAGSEDSGGDDTLRLLS